MAKQKLFLHSTIGLCLTFSLLYPALATASSYLLDNEPAQGDGDPSEETLNEITVTEKDDIADSDEDVATITAEGDFLVPTYLLPVAEESAVAASNTEENVSVTKKITTTTTTTTTTQELPIYVVSDTSATSADTDTTQNKADNTDKVDTPETLVEPAPTVVVDVQVKPTQPIIEEPVVPVKVQPTPPTPSHNIGTGYHTSTSSTKKKEETKILTVPTKPVTPSVDHFEPARPILIPLAPLPKVAEPEPTVEPHIRKIVPSEYADKMLTALEDNKRPDFIMPQEIKVSFYKNASHFSGQTIKWIKAFSVSAMNDPRLIVQVRLSTQTPAIQQKRLSVIQNTLIGNGLSPHQIQVVFTERPADSLILRTIVKPEHTQVSVKTSKTGRRTQKQTTRW